MAGTLAINDNARLAWALVVALCIVAGAVCVAIGIRTHASDCCAGSMDAAYLIALGTLSIALPLGWGLVRPVRPRTLLLASAEGIELPALSPVSGLIPWHRVGECLLQQGETWELVVPVNLPEPQRLQLRNREGGYPRRADGYVDILVPATSRRRASEWLHAIAATRAARL